MLTILTLGASLSPRRASAGPWSGSRNKTLRRWAGRDQVSFGVEPGKPLTETPPSGVSRSHREPAWPWCSMNIVCRNQTPAPALGWRRYKSKEPPGRTADPPPDRRTRSPRMRRPAPRSAGHDAAARRRGRREPRCASSHHAPGRRQPVPARHLHRPAQKGRPPVPRFALARGRGGRPLRSLRAAGEGLQTMAAQSLSRLRYAPPSRL